MDRQTFRDRLHDAANAARDFARTLVEEPLADAILFRIRLNSSYDGNPLVGDERVYPEDSSAERARELSVVTEDVVVANLWRDGAIPEWINVSVIGESRDTTLVELLVCGRFTADERLLYHAKEGRPPFHVLGPSLPVDYTEGQRFSIYYRSECWNAADLEQLRPHRHKIWSLELFGDDFDDNAIASLPDLPSLEMLELRGTSSAGAGLGSLLRHPRLRVLRFTLSEGRPFSVGELPELAALESLDIAGLPARPWGFGRLARSLPRLAWLTLESQGDLVLDGVCPRAQSSLTLTGRRVTGGVSLPQRLDMVGIHLSGVSGPQIQELLASVEVIRSLSLRNTPVDESTAMRLAAQFQLEFLDLVGTGLNGRALRGLATAYPYMRIIP